MGPSHSFEPKTFRVASALDCLPFVTEMTSVISQFLWVRNLGLGRVEEQGLFKMNGKRLSF